MGRPDPCILFAQSFVHSQLDEYVDEVIFAEPVVVTAFEILELNSSPSVSAVSITGATSPPSFALEVFVQCEGESRFRRLCPAFLYSHSSSNSLEVEVVVTSHLVIRGSYRSLTLVIYGNTSADLGQFNIEFDLDSSLANLVSSPLQGKLEDLPPAFSSVYLPFEESISSFKLLTQPFPVSDLSREIKEFLNLIFKIYRGSYNGNILYEAVRSVVSAVSSYVSGCHFGAAIKWDEKRLRSWEKEKDKQQIIDAVVLARNELAELFRDNGPILVDQSNDSLKEEIAQELTSELLVQMYNQCFLVGENTPACSSLSLSQDKDAYLQLGIVLLLCSAKESCFHFVNSGGLQHIVHMLNNELQRSSATILMLLSVVEHATRHAIGCEGFLGWWPRKDENVPVGSSDGYSYLLSLLLQNQRSDVASILTYILHRLRTYEIACRYESAALSSLKDLCSGCYVADPVPSTLLTANDMLKKILKLLEFDCVIEEISPLDSARRSSTGQTEGLLSYKATVDYITSSKYNSPVQDIDTHLLFLLKERGFLPLSAALLSSPILRSGNDTTIHVFMEIMASIELIVFSLLQCRPGLTFLLLQPEATTTLIHTLKGVDDLKQGDSLTLRDASVLISNGFFCHSEEVGIIVELHLRVVLAIDRLLSSSTHSEEQLWILWELCTISRSECGRQALLVIQHFPEAISVLLECLRSFKDSEQITLSSASNLVIFHCAAEILEILVTDSTASSLGSWINNAMELHKALHLSSPGSNRKDAPTRLLEWIDAGAVYHKKGAAGLLRYAAVLASGGDAHLTSTSVLVSDSMDVENVVGDSMSSSDSQILDNLLGKLVSDKYFDGVSLCITSLVQLTTAFRILAFISQDSAVAVSLFEEGAINLLYVVLVNCKFMLERSSNNYDYLVDEGAECKSTSDLLLERTHEQNLVDILIPALILLINLLKKLQDAKEQYRNTKLLNALLKLHREVSPKVALIATDFSVPLPSSSLGCNVVCRLIGSAVACWPIFGWAPGLFHCLLESVQATSALAMGPKDACSILCLLTDLLPEECMWLWKSGVPASSAIRRLSVGTILGPQWECFVNWYLQPDNQLVLLGRLGQQLDKITQIVINFSSTALEVILDMLRVFLVRIACQKIEFATSLLHPLIFYISKKINETSVQEANIFKVYRLLNFVVGLLEHPKTKNLMISEGIVGVLADALSRCHEFVLGKSNLESRSQGKSLINMFSWSRPIFKSLSLIFSSDKFVDNFDELNELKIKNFTEDVSSIVRQLIKLCQILPVGKELLACLINFKELAYYSQGRSSFAFIFAHVTSLFSEVFEQDYRIDSTDIQDESSWKSSPPFSLCFRRLLKSIDLKDEDASLSVQAAHAMCLGLLYLCVGDKTLEGIKLVKFLFGIPCDLEDTEVLNQKLKDIYEMISLLDQNIAEQNPYLSSEYQEINLLQVRESLSSFMFHLLKTCKLNSENEPSDTSVDGFVTPSHLLFWKMLGTEDGSVDFSLGGIAETFVWECPDSVPEKLTASSLPKRKPSADGSNRRTRDNMGAEPAAGNTFSRGTGTVGASSGSSRRDTFRQRKPNTSRPPSMHVDDYVARERNIDGVSSCSNVIGSGQRGGSASGRPPSIHVDEFMARQRERQNPTAVVVGEATQTMNVPTENDNSNEKTDASRKLKTCLDDDLHEIDIVFDAESESDDKLPFPHPDENLLAGPVMAGESPISIVEENEGDINDESRSELPSRPLNSGPEVSKMEGMELSSEKSQRRPELKGTFPFGSSKTLENSSPLNPPGFPSTLYSTSALASSVQQVMDSRKSPSRFHMSGGQQTVPDASTSMTSRAYYEQKISASQPPLPPTPPPYMSSMPSKAAEAGGNLSSAYAQHNRDHQPLLASGYPLQPYDMNASSKLPSVHVQPENLLSSSSNFMASLPTNQPLGDSKQSWMTPSLGIRESVSVGTSIRPPPPLPPTPPPFTSSSIAQSLMLNSSSQSAFSSSQPPLPPSSMGDLRSVSFSTSNSPSFSPSPLASQLLLMRPTPATGPLLSSVTQSQNLPSLSPPLPSRPPPPPPPQGPRPPHLIQHLRPPLQVPQVQPDQMATLQQSHIPIQVQPLQVPQQIQIPQIHFFYQAQQEPLPPVPQSVEPSQPSNPSIQTPDNAAQAQQDSGLMLQQYFASPEAIQSLLSDRDKLCQLLEQHPKLMQMLQERLGQS